MSRQQTGYIWKEGRSWFGRWREDVLVDGQVLRKQRSKKLVEYCDRYRSESDVRPLLDDILRPLNQGRSNPQSSLTVAEYVRLFFLPHVEAECKPSTVNGYKATWKMYLAVGLKNVTMRDFRCVDATNLLADIYRQHGSVLRRPASGRGSGRHLGRLRRKEASGSTFNLAHSRISASVSQTGTEAVLSGVLGGVMYRIHAIDDALLFGEAKN